MSGERELLELAAKGAGYRVCHLVDDGSAAYVSNDLTGERFYWRPATDDGDALRLAVKLDLLAGPVFWHERSIQAAADAFNGDRQDPYAATRRAIVRAAAEIGKAKP